MAGGSASLQRRARAFPECPWHGRAPRSVHRQEHPAGRIPDPARSHTQGHLGTPQSGAPRCQSHRCAQMGSEPDPNTSRQTCLGPGFVCSRGLDEGWQDRQTDRMDRGDTRTATALRSQRRNPAPTPSPGQNQLLLPSPAFPAGVTQNIKDGLEGWELQPPSGAFAELHEPCPPEL